MNVLKASAAALAAAGWVAAPFVSMRRHGTLDEQHSGELELAAIRAEAERHARAERAQRAPAVPAPRAGEPAPRQMPTA